MIDNGGCLMSELCIARRREISTTGSKNDRQCPDFHHKIVLDAVLPRIEIEPTSDDDVETLEDEAQHAAELHECEVLPYAAGGADGERDECGMVEEDRVRCVRGAGWVVPHGCGEPAVGPECVWEGGEVAWVAVEGVGVYECLGAFWDEAGIGVCERWGGLKELDCGGGGGLTVVRWMSRGTPISERRLGREGRVSAIRFWSETEMLSGGCLMARVFCGPTDRR